MCIEGLVVVRQEWIINEDNSKSCVMMECCIHNNPVDLKHEKEYINKTMCNTKIM